MDKKDAVLQAVTKATGIRKNFSHDSWAGFDLIEVVKELDIPLVFRSLDSLWGATVSSEDYKGIIINSKLPRQVQRFTLAHEIGHIILDHENSFDHEEDLKMSPRASKRNNRPMEEIAADEFASELLGSKSFIARNVRARNWGVSDLQERDNLYQLSLRLGLSFTATCWTLEEHDILEYDFAKGLVDNTTVKDVKTSFLNQSIDIKGHDDVWKLDAGDDDLVLEAGPDDIFVIKLSEKASSGYTWDGIEKNPGINVLNSESAQGKRYGDELEKIVHFELKGGGLHTLNVQHKRPWSDEVLEEITIRIRTWDGSQNGLPRQIRQKLVREAMT